MKHVVETKVLNDILGYLSSRPYNEAAPLIKALQDSAVALQQAPAENVEQDNSEVQAS